MIPLAGRPVNTFVRVVSFSLARSSASRMHRPDRGFWAEDVGGSDLHPRRAPAAGLSVLRQRGRQRGNLALSL